MTEDICIEASQSEEDIEFTRRMSLPLQERIDNGYYIGQGEMIEFIFNVAVEAKALIDATAPQIAPILAGLEKNPMLKMFLKK